MPDQDAALDFYVGKLGFEVKIDQPFGPMRFLTVALPTDPGHAVLLEKPGPPGYRASSTSARKGGARPCSSPARSSSRSRNG